MAKPKNQTELTRAFLNGETSGTVGHLYIRQDTLYNTEYNEFLPVARRVHPPGDNIRPLGERILLVINDSWYEYKHESYRQQKQKIFDILTDPANPNEWDELKISYQVMKTYSKSYDQHPLEIESAKAVIEYQKSMVTKHRLKIKHIEEHTYDRYDYEKGYTDAEMIEASTQLADDFTMISEYLQSDLDEVKFKEQINDIEELVRAPQIMEQAIKNGGMDPAQLQRMLKTRDKVKEMIKNVEQHISIILEIPGPEDKAEPHA